MDDRLQQIKDHIQDGHVWYGSYDDVRWLVREVERLQSEVNMLNESYQHKLAVTFQAQYRNEHNECNHWRTSYQDLQRKHMELIKESE